MDEVVRIWDESLNERREGVEVVLLVCIANQWCRGVFNIISTIDVRMIC